MLLIPGKAPLLGITLPFILQFQMACLHPCALADPHLMAWRRWQPTPVFLPGELCGQRSLVGCRPWGCTESDMTEMTLHA